MKVKDITQRDVIKSLLGDLQNSEHTKHPKSYKRVIDLAIKKRLEAARLSLESSPPRRELNEKNLKEAEILKKYLSLCDVSPTTSRLSEDELTGVIQECMHKLGLSVDATKEGRQQHVGKLIKSVKEKVGSNIDGKLIADTVKKVIQ